MARSFFTFLVFPNLLIPWSSSTVQSTERVKIFPQKVLPWKSLLRQYVWFRARQTKIDNIGHVRIEQNFVSLLSIDISFVQVCLDLYQERTFDVYRCLLFLHGKHHETVRNRGFSRQTRRKIPSPYISRQNVLNPYSFALLRKTIMIWTPERV